MEFLKPTGIDSPLAISRWVCDSVVRAPTAAQATRSAVYWGTMGSSTSVAVGSPSSLIASRMRRAMRNPSGMSEE